MSRELLEKFADCLHIKCLSDLHGIGREEIIYIIGEVPVKEYSLEAWNYALTYVLGTKTEITNYKQLTPKYFEDQIK